ncbi:MAG: hypothetical protein V1913_06465 [Fibrobacterota bacterium]
METMFDDHERFMSKNRMLAQGYETSKLQDKVNATAGDGRSDMRPTSCFNCKKKNKCLEFKQKSTGGSSGTVSIDTSTVFLCDRYAALPPLKHEKSLSGPQVKSIMKAALKGRL